MRGLEQGHQRQEFVARLTTIAESKSIRYEILKRYRFYRFRFYPTEDKLLFLQVPLDSRLKARNDPLAIEWHDYMNRYGITKQAGFTARAPYEPEVMIVRYDSRESLFKGIEEQLIYAQRLAIPRTHISPAN